MQLPDSLPVSDALRRFKTEREQFAIVVDERGGVAGIVTRLKMCWRRSSERSTTETIATSWA